MFAPVSTNDGRIYNVSTVLGLLQGGTLTCPFTRQPLATTVKPLASDGSIDLVALEREVRDIESGKLSLSDASWAARTIRSAVLRGVKSRGEEIGLVPPFFLDDLAVVTAAAQSHPEVARALGPTLREDRGALLSFYAAAPAAFAYAPRTLRRDRGFVLELVRAAPSAYVHVHPRLRSDRGVAARAMAHAGGTVKVLPATLRSDPLLVGLAVRRAGRELAFAPLLRRDSRLAALAVAVSGQIALEVLDPELGARLAPCVAFSGIDVSKVLERHKTLGGELTTVLLAAARPGWVGVQARERPSHLPAHVTMALATGRAAAFVACLRDGRRFAALDAPLREDHEIAGCALLHPEPGHLSQAGDAVRGDAGLVEGTLPYAPSAYRFASASVRRLPALALAAVRAEPKNLAAVDFESIRDPEVRGRIVDAALEGSPSAIVSAPAGFATPDRMRRALARDGSILSLIPEAHRTPEMFELAVGALPAALEGVPASYQTPTLIRKALSRDGLAVAFVAPGLLTEALAELSVRSEPLAFRVLPPAFQTESLRNLAVELLVVRRLASAAAVDIERARIDAVTSLSRSADAVGFRRAPLGVRAPFSLEDLGVRTDELG